MILPNLQTKYLYIYSIVIYCFRRII